MDRDALTVLVDGLFSKALQARRIGEMGGWTLPLQIIVIAGLPALVLIAGIVVYVVRRG